jgi:hypothetical protein
MPLSAAASPSPPRRRIGGFGAKTSPVSLLTTGDEVDGWRDAREDWN